MALPRRRWPPSRSSTAWSISSSRNEQGRGQAQGGRRDRVDDQTGVEGGGRDRAGPFALLEFDGDEQPEAPDGPTPGSFSRAAVRYAAAIAGPGPARPRLPSPRARPGLPLSASGWPPKVVAWSPGQEGGRHVVAGPAGADRHAVAERLGDGHHVGLYAVVLEAEPAPGSPQAGLHLVDDHQDAALVAQAAHSLEVLGAGGLTPPSPCTGSSSTAATDGSRAEARASRSRQATWRNPSGSG